MNENPPVQSGMIAGECADSIFRYIERTAIMEPNGFRWRTLAYNNKYTETNSSLFNGVTGISLFLADYHDLNVNERAGALAKGALEWCTAAPLE